LSTVRIVYEHGVAVQRSADGAWYFESAEKQFSLSPIAPDDVAKHYELRPIVYTTQLPDGNDMASLLSQTKGKLPLDGELSKLAEGDWRNEAILHEIFNLRYVFGAIIHHCKRLADVYSGVCSRFAHVTRKGRDSDKVIYGPQLEPYYEFDALITAAKRLYSGGFSALIAVRFQPHLKRRCYSAVGYHQHWPSRYS
jgi:hypothetical protein